jgi:pimeloyl-ACP methyl ester carboxylesterase
MLHGSGQSHLTWVLQSRYFAYRGYSVLAPDFPGHGLSGGEPLSKIEDMAEWVLELMGSLGVDQAILVGHSQGALVALEAASSNATKFNRLALIAGAMNIPVNETLINLSDTALTEAISAMMSWGHGPKAHMHDNTQPGHSFIGYGSRLMAENEHGALRADLMACNAYQNGATAAASISQPTCCILAEKDRMTPLKLGKALAATLPNSQEKIIPSAGHMLPAECPNEVNAALKSFFQQPL